MASTTRTTCTEQGRQEGTARKKGVRKRDAEVERLASGGRWTGSGAARGGPGGDADELCAMFDESSDLNVRSFLPEEGLGHGPVVPFPAYGFAALVSHNDDLNSLNRRP